MVSFEIPGGLSFEEMLKICAEKYRPFCKRCQYHCEVYSTKESNRLKWKFGDKNAGINGITSKFIDGKNVTVGCTNFKSKENG